MSPNSVDSDVTALPELPLCPFTDSENVCFVLPTLE